MKSSNVSQDSISMVERTIQIINELFSADKPKGASELSTDLGLPKVTVFRILNTLYLQGLVEKNKEDKYSLGLVFIQYGEKVKSKIDLKTLAEPVLNELSRLTGETVNLGILSEEYVVTVFSAEGESSALVSRLIPLSPLNCSSMGKIFLSTMTEKDAKAYFDKHLEKRTFNTITKYEDFVTEKEKFMKSKVSYDIEEYEYGLGCVAAPIYNSSDKTVAAISLSGPLSRLKIKGIQNMVDEIQKASKAISDMLKQSGIK